jgi:hypothetical protein
MSREIELRLALERTGVWTLHAEGGLLEGLSTERSRRVSPGNPTIATYAERPIWRT